MSVIAKAIIESRQEFKYYACEIETSEYHGFLTLEEVSLYLSIDLPELKDLYKKKKPVNRHIVVNANTSQKKVNILIEKYKR